MNYRKESGSRETRTLSPGLLTMIVKIRLKHVSKDAGCLERELQSVNSAVLETARRMGLFRKQVICAIDSSDTEYYGETDTMVVGGKQKNGTNGFHRISTTVPVTGGIKFDLGMVVRKQMDSDTGAIRSLIDSSSACVDAWLYLLDRGFRSAENWNCSMKWESGTSCHTLSMTELRGRLRR